METVASPSKKSTRTQPISVGTCHVQTAKDRYGQDGVVAIRDRERMVEGLQHQGPSHPFVWPGQVDDDQDKEAKSSIFRKVPSMQLMRHNLTTLSQCFNLYFSAYQGRIFVYALRGGPTNTVPEEPDLQLKPKPSPDAKLVGGFIDKARPHTVNHLITGFLGTEEILLAAYDNGDVVAYYTKPIADLIFHKSPQGEGVVNSTRLHQANNKSNDAQKYGIPKPFLHENVRKTAWGLAIHQKSRLIAVSTNLREITVFALALRSPESTPNLSPHPSEPLDDLEKRVRMRQRNWRIQVRLGPDSDNIPNICFLDDDEGHAEKVCGIDIKGAIWVAYIWKPYQPVTQIAIFDRGDIISEESSPQTSRGWGVLAFRDDAFLTVHSVEDLIGMPPRNCAIKPPTRDDDLPMAMPDEAMRSLPDNPCPPPKFPRIAARRPRITGPILMGTVTGMGLNFQAVFNNDMDITLQAFPVMNGPPMNGTAMNGPGAPPPNLPGLNFTTAPDSGSSEDEDDEADEVDPDGDQELDEDSDSTESSGGATAGSYVMPPDPLFAQMPLALQNFMALQQQGPPPQAPPQPPPQPDTPAAAPAVPVPTDDPPVAPPMTPHTVVQLNQQPSTAPHSVVQAANGPPVHPTLDQLSDSGPPVLITQSGYEPPVHPALQHIYDDMDEDPPTAQAFEAAQAAMVSATLDLVQNEMLLPFQNAFGTLGQALDELEHAYTQFENSIAGAVPPFEAGRADHQMFGDCKCPECRQKVRVAAAVMAQALEHQERLNMVYFPGHGEVQSAPWNRRGRVQVARGARIKTNKNVSTGRASEGLTRGYYILRAFEKDFEMFPLVNEKSKDKNKPQEIGVMFSDALTCEHFNSRLVSQWFRAAGRLNMLVHIPELCLVALGSPTGRVMLVTLTRMGSPVMDATGSRRWEHGIRPEAVLPRIAEEAEHRKSPRALHGLALAVVPEDLESGKQGLPLRKRYRLLLHYQSHDILSYEISRDAQSGRLWVV